MKRLSSKVMSTSLLTLLTVVGLSLPCRADRRHSDIENIGNRSVAGHIFGILPNWISLDKEIAIGQQVAQQFEQTARLI